MGRLVHVDVDVLADKFNGTTQVRRGKFDVAVGALRRFPALCFGHVRPSVVTG
ncbi:hypothetical protein D3C83_156850 [compost metagenome]